MTRSSTWIPLGSANVIDWKALGRSPSLRAASAWVGQLDEEPLVLRASGEDTTSSYEFVLLTDERVAGTIVVQSSRTEGNLLRINTVVDVEGFVSFMDTCDFRENPRTLLLSFAGRSFEPRRGALHESAVDPISAACAELFEIAPDSAMQTVCADWLRGLIAVIRNFIRGTHLDAARSERGSKPHHASRAESPGQRRPELPRSGPSRDSDGGRPIVEVVRDRPSDSDPRADDTPEKLICSTNTGERFEIVGRETFIGRSKQCEIVLKSARVSRKHACVTREDDGFYINDVGAANGIWNGSMKIDRERIGHGDEFVIGDVVLSFTHA